MPHPLNKFVCAECGYDLRGLATPICPECGRSTEIVPRHRRRGRAWWLLVCTYGLLIAESVILNALFTISMASVGRVTGLSDIVACMLPSAGLSYVCYEQIARLRGRERAFAALSYDRKQLAMMLPMTIAGFMTLVLLAMLM